MKYYNPVLIYSGINFFILSVISFKMINTCGNFDRQIKTHNYAQNKQQDDVSMTKSLEYESMKTS